MRARIQKWGNSLGARIPKALAADINVSEGTMVDLTAENGCLVIAPERSAKFAIEKLVAGITTENRHGATDTGSRVGREIW